VTVLTESRVEWVIKDATEKPEPPAEKPKKKEGEEGAPEEEPPA
jgi:hypothetical protein